MRSIFRAVLSATLAPFTAAAVAAVALFLAAAAPLSSAQSNAPNSSSRRAPHLTVSLLEPVRAVAAGKTVQIGLYFVLDKGWHIYWVNAGDSGEPPAIRWRLPSGITASPMQFPAPQRLPLGPLMDFGYENDVLFPMELRASPSFRAPSNFELKAHVTWLVCREVCIPGKADLTLPFRRAAQPRVQAVQALFQRFQARLPRSLPASSDPEFATDSTGFVLAIGDLPKGQALSSAEFFPLNQGQIDNAAPQKALVQGGELRILIRKDENLRQTPALLDGVLTLSGGPAYIVQAKPAALSMEGWDVSGSAAAAPEIGGSMGAHETSTLRMILFAFLGGLVLNLMPCVFPVLFIKALALIGSSQEARHRLRAHGFAYAFGILVSFWIVAGLLIGFRSAGRTLGWGFQFQSPGFIAMIALLLFFLGLSLAGMFEFGLTLTSAGSSLADRKGYVGSFFTGVLAMVVATPCTAPFMGVALGFALAASPLEAFVIFTALGLGLAAPYLLLTLRPAWTKFMPAPGAWMEKVKQLFSIPIFAIVIWLVWLYVQSAGVTSLSGLLVSFLLLAISGWILGHWPARRAASLAALAVIALAAALPLYLLYALPSENAADASSSAAAQAGDRARWQPYSRAAVERYRAEGLPVFVDFTASWCLSCQVNERVVLDRADVQKRLRDSGVVLLKADWTRRNEEIERSLNRLGRSGVPTYVLYPPRGSPYLLPEVLTPGAVYAALEKIKHA